MRPLPVILLLVALASALVTGVFLVGRGDAGHPAPTADRAPSATTAREEAGSTAPALDATGAEGADSSRAAPLAVRESAPAGSAPPAKKKEAATVALSGRVLGNLGKPVEGAVVYAAESNDLLLGGLDEIDPEQTTWVHRAEAKTDHEGRFLVRPAAGGKVILAVRAPGFAPFDREFSISGAERDLGDLALAPSVVLSGRVVDSNGRAVAGARIARIVAADSGFSFFGGSRGATVATTDSQGAFRVDQLAAGAWHLLVTHEDHPDHVESGETDRAGAVVSDLVVTLEEGSEIQGKVVGAPAEIASKLRVRAVPRAAEESVGSDNPPSLLSSPSNAARTARCGADGSFTLKGLKRSQRYRLTAQESSREFFRGSRSVPVSAQSGDRGVELAFKPETALVFQVVDAKSGKPVVELGVQAGYSFPLPLMDDEGRPVKRFPEGRVRYGGLPAAPRANLAGAAAANSSTASGLKLRIEAPGYQAFDRSDIAAVEGQDTDLGVLRLEPAPVVTVLVLDDATSAPIVDATVRLAEEGPKAEHGRARVSFTVDDDDSGDVDAFGPGTAQRARTGADGKASVTSLPGKTARISVRHAGYALYQSEAIALPLQESLEQTVRLSLGGSVTVEVVDSHGAPVSGADVDHQGPGGGSAEMMLSNSDSRSDAEGKVVFDHLPTGAHRFRLRQGSGNGVFSMGGNRAVVRRVTRSGGDDEPGWSSVDVDGHTAATIRLVAPEHGTLAGRVSEAGQPLANATLQLMAKGEEDTPSFFRSGGRNTHTDSRGEYLFDGVDEGEYTVSVEHATRAMTFEAATRVRAGENRLDLDLPVAIVEGTVTGEDGKPVAGVRIHAEKAPSASGGRRVMGMSVMVLADGGDEPEVSVQSSASASPTVITDATGHYSLRGVLPDVELVVEADAKDVQPARSAAFKAKPDDVKKGVDLRLERGGTIQVSVQRAGQPTGGFLAHATLLGADGEAGAPPAAPKIQMVGQNGSTKLTGLKPGKWRVSLDSIGPSHKGSDEPIPEKEIEVRVGETAQAPFQVP